MADYACFLLCAELGPRMDARERFQRARDVSTSPEDQRGHFDPERLSLSARMLTSDRFPDSTRRVSRPRQGKLCYDVRHAPHNFS